ncbi:hypothetical protein AB0M02_31245 [Actinoplanes sp. NPDC051861]|uniref:hypothetical protein n=1 Tax=Actinoplanes sp. NPDC051861 TaxID=3155170 RepID=UPI003440E1DF
MHISRAALAASVLIGSSSLFVGAAAGPALAADSYRSLPLVAFGDVAVDGLHKRVLMSDPAAKKIIATDYSGTVVDELQLEGWANEITLVGETLYVPAEHSIIALAADTLTETKRYPLGDDVYPNDVVEAGGKLWFTFSKNDRPSFGSVNPADSTVYLRPYSETDDFVDAPGYIYSTPAAPGTIVVTGDEVGLGTVTVYDVSSGGEVEKARITPANPASESAFTVDGGHLIRVGSNDESQLKVGDLSTALTYPAYYRANGVDVASDGRVAISVMNQATGHDVYVFAPGGTTPTQTITLPEAGDELVPGYGELPRGGIQDRGIAWEPNGNRIFAVAKYDGVFRLWVLNEPVVPVTPALTLNRNGGIYNYGTTVSFTAHLGTTATNRTVQIWAQPTGAGRILLKSGPVDSAGNLTGSLRLTRNTRVTAQFAGDAGYLAREVSATVYTRAAVSTKVTKHYRTKKIGKVGYQVFRKKATPVFTTTMTPYSGRKAQVIVNYWSGGKWRTVNSRWVKLSANGTAVLKYTGSHKVGGKFRVRSAYVHGTSGDRANYTTYGAWKYFTFTK